MRLCRTLLLAGLTALAAAAHALTPEQARAIASGETDDRITALDQAVARGDTGLPILVNALLDDAVKLTPKQVLIVQGESVLDAATGAPVTLPEDAEDVVNNNRMRGALQAAQAAAQLLSPDLAVRREAVAALGKQTLEMTQLPLIDKALSAEKDPELQEVLGRMKASILVAAPDKAQRLEAVRLLGASGRTQVKSLLQERLAPGAETDPEVRGALLASLDKVSARLAWGERLGVLFTGLSLGSILLLVALGLAITYGLMGVINMAHGELMMIGAYATYVVQNLFKAYAPGAVDYYLWLAVPAAFLAAAAVGAVLERLVIRWLYGRPLETLLATWGISLVLMQGVRSLFGAQNVPVENPAWLSGGIDVMSNLTLPYNRIAIIAFAFLVLGGVALLIAKTRLGLFVRGVTQNRRMAACMGVNTARIDTYAFSLGAGIAGLAGCALSQVGNVGPDLGQGYIVDSFMVVVLGGVGQLAGTVYAALGLGVLNKFLEGWAGAVLAKIMVLVVIVVFIQKRPQGLFAMKGRSAEA
ncbi:urea ABC transporter permease subunit UrtB [Ideonella dechloratans]|uniref:Urea ABC transporter permease subunit UrtB n=1 Tax=Ideonella dechloratans TaxID=36863 RepID=A0A643FHU4_IDEDE|nr:urea ABC transporter permease subunit UrtB [Ideonella dechloratans]KAB0585145.1 urea ABC transporter permease subunit UrtB [Ideonella dechloratans]UFU11036.1 urea ABC transporter permease subunit UrtB [Ideonella dechloratans]